MHGQAEFGPAAVGSQPDADIAQQLIVLDRGDAQLRPLAGLKAGIARLIAQKRIRLVFRHHRPALIAGNVGIASIRMERAEVGRAQPAQPDACIGVRQMFEQTHRPARPHCSHVTLIRRGWATAGRFRVMHRRTVMAAPFAALSPALAGRRSHGRPGCADRCRRAAHCCVCPIRQSAGCPSCRWSGGRRWRPSA